MWLAIRIFPMPQRRWFMLERSLQALLCDQMSHIEAAAHCGHHELVNGRRTSQSRRPRSIIFTRSAHKGQTFSYLAFGRSGCLLMD
ncbi:hypothetical protein EVAR_57624_1 [Eumeta japonica]|uniref:Uncharacterized protein n=1 Tax=Eumeta variegata TaxID=151549 RepID=A0A4C1ZSL6_EUMVA|nr:hypothetical protein EVAR_57624_1 [Eumeta japonica]